MDWLPFSFLCSCSSCWAGRGGKTVKDTLVWSLRTPRSPPGTSTSAHAKFPPSHLHAPKSTSLKSHTATRPNTTAEPRNLKITSDLSSSGCCCRGRQTDFPFTRTVDWFRRRRYTRERDVEWKSGSAIFNGLSQKSNPTRSRASLRVNDPSGETFEKVFNSFGVFRCLPVFFFLLPLHSLFVSFPVYKSFLMTRLQKTQNSEIENLKTLLFPVQLSFIA